MNKKYLSALLFGALTLASTVTFTSCKDYDDDIENLQGQIADNASKIAELQKLVGDGNFVKSVVPSADGITVTMSNGTSVPVTIKGQAGQDGKPGSVVSIAENGEITIDGVGTGFFATKGAAGKVNMPFVKEGQLYTFDAEGKEVATGIFVSPVTAVQNIDGSVKLVIKNVDGTQTEVELPSAASSITNLKLTITETTPQTSTNAQVKLSPVQFTFTGGTTIDEVAKWKGTKDVNNKVVVDLDAKMDIEVSPASVDASKLTFTLVNTKGEVAKDIQFTAEKSAFGTEPDGTRASSAASSTNNVAKYTLKMNTVTFADFKAYTDWDKQFGKNGANEAVKFALAANGVVCTDYAITFDAAPSKAVDGPTNYIETVTYETVPATATINAAKQKWSNKDYVTSVNLNETYRIITKVATNKETDSAAGIDYYAASKEVYDMYYTVNDQDKNLFGIVAGDEPNTFKVTKEQAGKFTINVYSINMGGVVTESTVVLSLSSKIDTPAEYTTVEHAVVGNMDEIAGATKETNFFTVDLAAMKAALGDKLTQWNKDADHIALTIKDADGKEMNVNGGITTALLAKATDATSKTVAPELAKFIRFDIDNDKVNGALTHSTVYNFNIQFQTKLNKELNTIVVPVKFTIPTVASQFEVAAGAEVKENVIQAYLYEGSTPVVKIKDYFAKTAAKFSIADLDATAKVVGDKTQDDLFIVSNPTVFDKATLALAPDASTSKYDGYGIATTLTVNVSDYLGWKYGDTENTYKFGIRILSPLYEGTAALAKEGVISIKLSEITEGKTFKIYGEAFNTVDYKGKAYSIVPDKENKKVATWSNPYFKSGQPSFKLYTTNQSKNDHLTLDWQYYAAAKGATLTTPAVPEQKGAITVALKGKAELINADVEDEFTVLVTDLWGFEKEIKVAVKILAKE